tara:strand:+ start:79 stop:1719 length:1641 start_codon:yes stop_codon:yes gene_type:complete
MDQAIKEEHIPSGGIADFIYTDEELDILEQQELEAEYGKSGIAQFKKVGKKIASYGRYGDDTVAHVEKGELIVPRALIEGNPELKESIFSHLRELGIEDPERYVVGTSKNSINPDTGLPEFFLSKIFKGIKKGVSSIGRGVKSAIKSVGRTLKKVAPIIIPMALNFMFPGLGAVYSGALGAGIGTLVQGGSVQDAFKSALLGGATGAAAAGFAGEGGYANFGENVMADVSRGTANIKSAFQGNLGDLTQPSGPSLRGLFKEDVTPTTEESNLFGVNKRKVLYDSAKKVSSPTGLKPSEFQFDYLPGGPEGTYAPPPPPESTSLFDRAGNWLFRAGKSKQAMLDIQNKARSDAIASTLKGAKDAGLNVSSEAVQKAAVSAGEKAFADAGPSFLTKYGPSIGIAGLGLTAAGAFDEPEQERLDVPRLGIDAYNENPSLYNVKNITPTAGQGPYTSPTSYGFQYNPYLFSRTPFQTAAKGGEIFPRRTGGIAPNEGIPGQDSVRAMLMPGEFVMTTDAVKGLGNGDLNTGINNMYSVMRKLENKGRAMA